MARPLRIEFDGALYHVTSRGNERKAIFKDEIDRKVFLDTLVQVNDRFHWICHAYCSMANHYHLLLETPKANLNWLSRFASYPERPLRALREQGFERHRLRDESLLVHVAHERLERVPIALKPVWPEVLAHQVHGLVGVLDEER